MILKIYPRTLKTIHFSCLFTHELWRLFTLFHMSIFFRPPFSYLLQRVLCFILGLELFHKKEVWIFSKALITWVTTGAIRTWKTIFEIAKLLKTTNQPSRVRFRYRQRFNTLCTFWGSRIHLLFCYCMRNKYLKS